MAIMVKYAELPIQVRNIFTGRIEPLIIPAEAKVSYPVTNGGRQRKASVRGGFEEGSPPWSHLKKLKL
jgi:hypothetical protein